MTRTVSSLLGISVFLTAAVVSAQSAAPVPEPSAAKVTAPATSEAAPAPPASEPPAAPVAPTAPAAPGPLDGKLPATDPNGDTVVPPSADYLEASFGKGVTFLSHDKKFSLQLRGRLQPRFGSTFGDGIDPVNEFILRRARLAFTGRFLDAWELYLQLGLSNQDNEPDYYNPLRDATLTYAGFRDFNIRFGQMKVPFDRQRMNSSSALQFADRSIVVQELTLDRDAGIQVFSEDVGGWSGILGYNVGLFGGDGRNRRADNPGLMVVGRIWVSPFGHFDWNSEADLKRDEKLRLAIGVAAAKNFASVRARSTSAGTYDFATFDYSHLTADLTAKWRGFSLLGEFLYRDADAPSRTQTEGGVSVTEYSRSGWGFFAQAGYMWNKHIETVARYGELYPLTGTDPTLLRQREIGGALSYYFEGHNLKVTADYFYLPVLPGGPDTQQVRVQSQLFF